MLPVGSFEMLMCKYPQVRYSLFWGRNGVGKSTLLNSIIGLLSLTEGKVILGDQDLRKLSAGERARHVAYLTQIEGSGISYTVAEYLLMGRAPYIWTVFFRLPQTTAPGS